TGNTTITLTATLANTGTSSRPAVVTISGTGVASKTVSVTQAGLIAKPDLYFSDLLVNPTTVMAGGTINLSFKYGNQGNAPVSNFWVKMAFSKDMVFSNDDLFQDDALITETWQPGYYEVGSGNFDVPESLSQGLWYLILIIDPDNEIDESNETNNSISSPLNVSEPYLDIFPKHVIINHSAGSTNTFRILSNTDWIITNDATWFSVSQLKGIGNTTITLTAVTANTGSMPLSAVVKIFSEGVSEKSVEVIQNPSNEDKIYKWIEIGNQTWMAENLAYLPIVSPSSVGSDTDPLYYVYGYQGSNIIDAISTTNYSKYGVLYNWVAAQSACPSGSHLPSHDEWESLFNYLTNNGYGYGGSGSDIAKSLASTSGWVSSSTAGTVGNDQASNNRSGFTVLPGGICNPGQSFSGMSESAFFWSATEFDTSLAKYRAMASSIDFVQQESGGPKYFGLSVRCLKDDLSAINIGMNKVDNVAIFPNPTHGTVTIKITDYDGRPCKISVYTSLGSLVIKTVQLEEVMEMDISILTKGLYFIQIAGPNSNVYYKKLVLE
ncbi:MAG: FISUMP domain-containing protein, partial [Bacteroidales bacterium]